MSRREFGAYLAVSVGVFLLGIAAGYAVLLSGDPVADQMIEMVRNGVFADILGDSPAMLAVKIFLNNLQACLLLFLGGGDLRSSDPVRPPLERGDHRCLRRRDRRKARPSRACGRAHTPRHLRAPGSFHCGDSRARPRQIPPCRSFRHRGRRHRSHPSWRVLSPHCRPASRRGGRCRGIYYARAPTDSGLRYPNGRRERFTPPKIRFFCLV